MVSGLESPPNLVRTRSSKPWSTQTCRKEPSFVMIVVLEMMNSHLYEFNGKIFLQQVGGHLGHHATCAVARVLMNFLDGKWMKARSF